jgi:hypothetical protein
VFRWCESDEKDCSGSIDAVTQILGLGHDIDALLLSWDALFEDYKQFKDAQY